MGVARLDEDGMLHARNTEGRRTAGEFGAACPRTLAKAMLRFAANTM